MSKLRFIRACTTRWLSHGKACLRLVDRFVQVIDTLNTCLEEKYEAELFGIREQLLNKNTMAMVLILCDILKPVIKFSDFLQTAQVNFTDVVTRSRELVDELHLLIDRFENSYVSPDRNLTLNKMTDFFVEIDENTVFARRLRHYRVYTEELIVRELAIPVAYELINEITDAFHCSRVLKGFSVFDPKRVPDSMQEITDYGQTKIDALAGHYGNQKGDTFQGHRTVADSKYSAAEFRAQFTQFKPKLCLMKQRGGSMDITRLFQQPEFSNSFPAVKCLYELSQLVPPSTAAVERLFSLMNRLCTPARNNLSGYTAQDTLLRVCMHSQLNVDDVSKIIDSSSLK